MKVSSKWINVIFRTGCGSTGTGNWILHGTQLCDLEKNLQTGDETNKEQTALASTKQTLE